MDLKNNPWLSYLPLIITLVLLFWVVNPVFFQNTLESSSPNALSAGDAYAHLAYVNDVLEVGSYNREAQFYLGYNGEKLSPREPPLMFFYVAFLANLLNIPSYAAALLGLFLGLVLSISVLYLLIKKYSLSWAIAFLPATLFLFTHPFLALITWGFWKACFMYFVLFTSLILFTAELNWFRAALLVIISSSLILASPALLPYFLFIFLLKLILEKSRWKKNLFLLATSGIATLIIATHYFLNYALARTSSGQNKILEALGFQQGYQLYGANAFASHFGVFWYAALLGFVYGLFYLAAHFKERETFKFKLLALFSVFFVIFLLPAIGVTRIYQFRLVWPLLVAMFLGFTLYLALTLVKKKMNFNSVLAAGVIFILLLIGMMGYLNFTKTGQALTSPEEWKAYAYLHDQTPKESTLLVVDPVMNQESVMLSANRKLYYYSQGEFGEAAKNKTSLIDSPPTFYCAIPEKTREGFKVLTTEKLTQECKEKQRLKHTSCEFNYILINKQFYNQEQVDLMQEFINGLKMDNFQKIQDDQVLLLKNNKICTAQP